jgi:hypothetical protein
MFNIGDNMTRIPTPEVAESSAYDNYLDENARVNDKYRSSIDAFFEEPVDIPIVQTIPKKQTEKENLVRIINVHFRNIEDHLDFCNKVGQIIPYEKNEIYFPLENGILFDDDNKITNIDINLIRPKKSIDKSNINKLSVEDDPNYVGNKEWMLHWKGMPSFIQLKDEPYKSVYVKIKTEEDLKAFGELTEYNITNKTKFMWYPKTEKSNNLIRRWIGPESIPRYPMYIVSKGRHESMFTSRTFAQMKIPHYIVIEPQDYERYTEALGIFNINPYATLLVAPFSNHGDGPGRARNWAWDHSIALGAERHWVFDDNIKDFYRLHLNKRYRIMTGSFFNAMEDFVDRYENIVIAGPQYYFFCANSQIYPPYVLNTRIYSALLIRNDCKHRWRGRYNEDTDLSLRVLKDGDVTIQFNAFLQGKFGTQLLKGGNTEEFYHKEGNTDKSTWRDGVMNAMGTANKSKMLVDMHPDVASLVWKYGRWHHYVDYGPFRNNKLILKEGLDIARDDNEYGMTFVENYGLEEEN